MIVADEPKNGSVCGPSLAQKKQPSRHSTSRWTDGGTTCLRKALQEGSFEHCRPSDDFPWYSFLALSSWSVNYSSRFGFRVKILLTIGFFRSSFGWSGGGGQRRGTVRLESRIGESEQLKKLCLCDWWLDVRFHGSNGSEFILRFATGQLHPTDAIIKNNGNIPRQINPKHLELI